MSPAAQLKSPLVIDRQVGARGMVEFGFHQLQVTGSHPFTEMVSAEFPIGAEAVLDSSWTLTRADSRGGHFIGFATRGDDAALISVSGTGTLIQCASSTLKGVKTLARSLSEIVQVIVRDRTAATTWIRVWHIGGRGSRAESTDRRLAAMEWSQIADNYPVTARHGIEHLMMMDSPPSAPGRLVMWHGEPGAGKTSAARALMHAWSPWCATHYISDPDQFFYSAGYITEVLTSGGASQERWKLVIAEDCDEYLRANARQRAGASLGRLLNLTDGLLGQGTNTILLLTTNEPLGRVHPAITRPGRCLAVTEFPRLSVAEATKRLGSSATHDMTLAEIYQHLQDTRPINTDLDGPVSTGQYL